MNRKLIFAVVAVGVIIITIYNFQGTNTNTEGYLENIESDRAEKNELFKNGEDSPLTEEQKELFTELSYFPINEKYKVKAELHRNSGEMKIKMAITDGSQREYFIYGNAHIHLEGKEIDVTIYKPVDAEEDYLFLPFYDNTSADLTYGGGRYVEPEILSKDAIEIDFNKAYNPYCAYNGKYRCPIPPRGNSIDVSILAGEKNPEFAH